MEAKGVKGWNPQSKLPEALLCARCFFFSYLGLTVRRTLRNCKENDSHKEKFLQRNQ